jgi:hypothetical protein
MTKRLEEGQIMKVVEVSWVEYDRGSLGLGVNGTITLEDKDGDYLTFDIDPTGLPKTYEHSTSDI